MKVDAIRATRKGRTARRAVAALVAILLVTTGGLVASPTSAVASHGKCSRLECTGKYPGKQNCTPGTTIKSKLFYHPYASIKLMRSAHCNGVYWARLVWDGNPSGENFPVRWQIRVVRQQINAHTGWVRTHYQTRTIKKGSLNSTPPGSYNSKMIPYSAAGLEKRYRACARSRNYHSGGWTGWSKWTCTTWASA